MVNFRRVIFLLECWVSKARETDDKIRGLRVYKEVCEVVPFKFEYVPMERDHFSISSGINLVTHVIGKQETLQSECQGTKNDPKPSKFAEASFPVPLTSTSFIRSNRSSASWYFSPVWVEMKPRDVSRDAQKMMKGIGGER
jgi:hypothetical protein